MLLAKMNENILLARDDGDERAFGVDNTSFIIPEIKHDIRPKTNQGLQDKTTSACTMFGAWNQIIRLFGLDLDNKEANKVGLEIVEYCTKYGYVIGKGWSTPTAINTVCKWWNEVGAARYGKEKVFYERVLRGNALINEALTKGHLVGFTYNLNWNNDRYKGLVDKESYPVGVGHRTNIKSSGNTKATSGLKTEGASCGVHDNYYLRTNEYYIKNISKYINKGVYSAFYLILPISCLYGSIEQSKQEIKEQKALNSIVGILSTAYGDCDEETQKLASDMASSIRRRYTDTRKTIEDSKIKSYQAIVDALSYCWKFADEEEQKKYSELASWLREKHSLK